MICTILKSQHCCSLSCASQVLDEFNCSLSWHEQSVIKRPPQLTDPNMGVIRCNSQKLPNYSIEDCSITANNHIFQLSRMMRVQSLKGLIYQTYKWKIIMQQVCRSRYQYPQLRNMFKLKYTGMATYYKHGVCNYGSSMCLDPSYSVVKFWIICCSKVDWLG